MEREIKFRAINANKEMIYGLPFTDGVNDTAYFNEYSNRLCWRDENGASCNQPYKNGTLMQYTGLKDCKGKEIYEGDIVRKMDFDWLLTDEWEKDDPRWNDELPQIEVMRDCVTMSRFPCFWLEKEEFGYEGEDLVQVSECEVIGNIYENPELLK